MHPSAHRDTFTRQNLPPPEAQPEFIFELPELQFGPRLNAAVPLLVDAVARGRGARRCVLSGDGTVWSYAQLLAQASRIAHVLVEDMGLQTGNRVLLRSANGPMMAAAFFAVLLAGGVAVPTMPLLRARELAVIIDKAEVSHALLDMALLDEFDAARSRCPTLTHWLGWGAGGTLQAAMAARPEVFVPVATASDDVCLLAFTSGTTGVPKATMHYHRDLIAACACWPAHVLRPSEDDLFIGSPPLAFTFGLGGLLLFPMSVGAASVLLDKASPPQLLEGITRFGATVCVTAPTSYRAMAPAAAQARLGLGQGGTLRECVSAGEALPVATRAMWRDATGIEIIDGIGATEMLHIFVSADQAHARPGATGTVVPGYRACVMDEAGRPLPHGSVGRLAVKGPTGCRYLADARQASYVQGGWNFTGDAYLMDADGYFHHQARTDDMIVSAGYNIAAPEVEAALMSHPAVAECAVAGVPDAQRGQIVKAWVVPQPGHEPGEALAKALQEHVKQQIAPYKYPRALVFRSSLPRTNTGKLQRFVLRNEEGGA